MWRWGDEGRGGVAGCAWLEVVVGVAGCEVVAGFEKWLHLSLIGWIQDLE